ncbi:hypothetical protein KGF54_000191 [Candida jiufengensis]|uniref:uncharacterized protein n=1 Tax=Candida jiufengensis TaxID=497108 RepID=UPI0022244424|nr:uncharacterized protein KGF54_000191 [Candida jiufengensis]KAI5957263.1 hypothetical protein KGF54_000191 [Candida jiufengensis]
MSKANSPTQKLTEPQGRPTQNYFVTNQGFTTFQTQLDQRMEKNIEALTKFLRDESKTVKRELGAIHDKTDEVHVKGDFVNAEVEEAREKIQQAHDKEDYVHAEVQEELRFRETGNHNSPC